MSEVTNELVFELLKRVHHEIGEVRQDVCETKRELNVMRGHMVATQSDIHNVLMNKSDANSAIVSELCLDAE